MAGVEFLQLPEIIDYTIPVSPIRQPDSKGLQFIAGSYIVNIEAAKDEAHPQHERALAVVEVDGMLLGMLGLNGVIEKHTLPNNPAGEEIVEDEVQGLIMLWQEAWAEHLADPENERHIFRANEINFFLVEVGQFFFRHLEKASS